MQRLVVYTHVSPSIRISRCMLVPNKDSFKTKNAICLLLLEPCGMTFMEKDENATRYTIDMLCGKFASRF